MVRKVLLVLVCLMLFGCNEAVNTLQPQHRLLRTPDDWKEHYGDTGDVQIAYNFAVMRQNQLKIAAVIEKFHPPVDPNEITLESRVEALEAERDYQYEFSEDAILMIPPGIYDLKKE